MGSFYREEKVTKMSSKKESKIGSDKGRLRGRLGTKEIPGLVARRGVRGGATKKEGQEERTNGKFED